MRTGPARPYIRGSRRRLTIQAARLFPLLGNSRILQEPPPCPFLRRATHCAGPWKIRRSKSPAFNALVARLAQQIGFDAVYLSGAAFSAGTLALPDVGLFTLTELAEQTAHLTRSVTIPVIVDADTGFGEAIHVERTVRELEAAGAAAIQIEDQRWPKRCGHLSGKTLVEPAEMCAKLRAAAAARRDPDLVLIARTDARGVTSLDDAIDSGASVSGGRSRLDFSRSAGRPRRVRPLRRRDRRPAGGQHDRVRQKPAVVAR